MRRPIRGAIVGCQIQAFGNQNDIFENKIGASQENNNIVLEQAQSMGDLRSIETIRSENVF